MNNITAADVPTAAASARPLPSHGDNILSATWAARWSLDRAIHQSSPASFRRHPRYHVPSASSITSARIAILVLFEPSNFCSKPGHLFNHLLTGPLAILCYLGEPFAIAFPVYINCFKGFILALELGLATLFPCFDLNYCRQTDLRSIVVPHSSLMCVCAAHAVIYQPLLFLASPMADEEVEIVRVVTASVHGVMQQVP